MHGRKSWQLWPPGEASYAQRHVTLATTKRRRRLGRDGGGVARGGGDATDGADAATDDADSVEADADADADADDGAGGSRVVPLQCEQLPGEVLVVPYGWGHDTLNLAPSVGWASEVNFDRVYDDGFGRQHGDEWWRTG